MHIVKLELPQDILTKYGLTSVKLDKLKPIVIVTGKNGAGKSRLFDAINEFLNRLPLDNQVNQAYQKITDLELDTGTLETRIQSWKQELQKPLAEAQKKDYERAIEDSNNKIQSYKNQLLTQRHLIDLRKSIEFSTTFTRRTLSNFVPKKSELRDANSLPKNQLEQIAKLVDVVGMKDIENNVLAKIEYVQERWMNATHPEIASSKDEKENAINDYTTLKNLISIILGESANLSRSINGAAELYGRKIGEAKLSDGQKILLQFCVALHAQGTQLSDVILFMDEPENHLHPSILTETLERIRKNVTNGQIWIATHSVPLIGHFFDDEDTSVLYMEDGNVSYAGRKPEKVLEGLLGKEEERAKIASLLNAPAQFALEQYSYECLFVPKTVETDSKDPQTQQIFGILGQKINSGNSVRLLDFGAGKGRLISAIYELSREQLNFDTLLDYVAYDKVFDAAAKQADIEKCNHAITRMYGTSDKRYFNDKAALLGEYANNSFDMIILCNVFHEIEPRLWRSELFASDGIIQSLLKPDGHLLIVEDQLLAVGEKAYQHGFLVFDKPQFRKLFALQEEEQYEIHDARGDGRLKAHFIPKKYIGRASADTQKESIQLLQTKAKEEIERLRTEKESNYQNGKLYAFWLQQYVNASFEYNER